MKTTRKLDYYTINVEYPSGEWASIKIPAMFDMNTVSAHLSHCEIWLYVRKGYGVCAQSSHVIGPCWAHWDSNLRQYDMVQQFEPIAMNA